MLFIKVILKTLIVGLFFHTKFVPHRDKLAGNYKDIFNLLNTIFEPIITFLRKYMQPVQVGTGIAVDVTQFLILAILLLFL